MNETNETETTKPATMPDPEPVTDKHSENYRGGSIATVNPRVPTHDDVEKQLNAAELPSPTIKSILSVTEADKDDWGALVDYERSGAARVLERVKQLDRENQVFEVLRLFREHRELVVALIKAGKCPVLKETKDHA